MKKAVRTLSVIALIASLLALASFVVVLLLRNVLAPLYGSSTEIAFILPISPFVGVCGAILLSVFALLCGANKNVGIWSDILLIILAITVIPFLTGVLSTFQTSVSGLKGVEYVYSLSVLNNITTMTTSPATIARMLVLVVCGMSIAHKKLAPPEMPLYPPMNYIPQNPQNPQQPPMN